jgi:hypothetical protein
MRESIKQPWASLIAHGIKIYREQNLENLFFRGRIYIHLQQKE